LIAYFWDILEVNLNGVDRVILRKKKNSEEGDARVNDVDDITNDKPTDIEKGKAKVNEVGEITIGKPTDTEEASKANVNEGASPIMRKLEYDKKCNTKLDKVKAKKDNPKSRKAFETFILTLSDQQLVTGLAILIAGFLKCDISIYLFNNVWAFAWFSCTTHLATLTVLRR
jgi:hypothetical protein